MRKLIISFIVIISVLLFSSFAKYQKPEKILLTKQEYYKKIIGYNEVVDIVFKYAPEYPEIILGIINAESSFNRFAYSKNLDGKGVSVGIMQVNTFYHKSSMAVSIYALETNIKKGCEIFRKFYNEDYDITFALWKYNAGYRIIYPEMTLKYADKVVNYANILILNYEDYLKNNKYL